MTIKEVEKNTNLTAKTIRYYEDEGLIKVKRNEDNLYRNYSEEDVILLKKIKLFRYLDFSIDDINKILKMKNSEISKLLLKKVENLQEKNEENEIKKEMCIELSKDLKKDKLNLDKYEDIIHFYEDEEIQKELNDIEVMSSFELIAIFLICLGPIISLFLNIEREMWDILTLNSILAIISTIILTLYSRKYIYWYKNKRNVIKKKNYETNKYVLAFIISFFITIFLFISIYKMILENVFAPEGWLFYEFQFPTFFIVFLMYTVGYYLAQVIIRIINKEKISIKLSIIYLLILVLGSYMCLTSTTFVTDNSIVSYSPLNLNGKAYSYNDVVKVETKFGDKSFVLNEYNRKGNFQYSIYLDDRKFVFSMPSPNSDIEKYNEDTYLELEEFDSRLMKLNIKKISSDANSKYCDLDKRYCDRFLRIINTK